MSDPAILFVKPKAISAKDKKALQGAGVIVVEIDEPGSARFVRATAEINASTLLKAAAKAMHDTPHYNAVKEAFGKAVCEVLILDEPQQ